MDYVVISVVAFIMSGVTLFSGFGLSMVLMPTFALFFPVPAAIPATAVIVHLANNAFKFALVGRRANWAVVRRFSGPAAIAAVAGASLLSLFAGLPALGVYRSATSAHGPRRLRTTCGERSRGADA